MFTSGHSASSHHHSGTVPKISYMKEVLVFRTSVTTQTEVAHVQEVLNHLVEQDGRWNFDLSDWEHILRVETAVCRPAQVIAALAQKGHVCEELED